MLFFGHLLTNEGVKADPSKIEAICQMPAPRNATETQRFLGMITYLSCFLPKLTDISEPLRKTLLKNVKWTWTQEQEEAFQRIKILVTKSPVLSYHNVNKPVTIQCDALQVGLGAVFLQNGRPVAFASKTISL